MSVKPPSNSPQNSAVLPGQNSTAANPLLQRAMNQVVGFQDVVKRINRPRTPSDQNLAHNMKTAIALLKADQNESLQLCLQKNFFPIFDPVNGYKAINPNNGQIVWLRHK